MSRKRRFIVMILESIFIVTCSVSLAFSAWVLNTLYERGVRIQENCRMFAAESISETTVQYFCENDLMPSSINNCDGSPIENKHVGTIVKSNITEHVSTYTTVSDDFGQFEHYCEHGIAFICRYEFSTLAETILIYYDTNTSVVESVIEVTCGGS